MIRLNFDADALRPVIEQVVAETMRVLEEERARLGEPMAYPEPEAAALVGIRPHVLRDLRLSGEIEASKLGRRIVYTRDALVRLLEKKRWAPK